MSCFSASVIVLDTEVVGVEQSRTVSFIGRRCGSPPWRTRQEDFVQVAAVNAADALLLWCRQGNGTSVEYPIAQKEQTRRC